MSAPRPSKNYPIAAPGKGAWFVFLLIALSSPVALAGYLLARPQPWQEELWFAAHIALTIPGLLWAAMRRRAVEFDGSKVEIRATLYTRRIEREAFDLEKARVVNLEERRECRPRWKTNGFNLPGYLAGNFRGKGGQRQFVLLTRKDRVLLLPLRNGDLVMLSLERPQTLLDDLQRSSR